MTTIHDLVQAAYPGADPMIDYIVQDDGAGPYLAQWHIAGPIPAEVLAMATNKAIAQWVEAARALQEQARQMIVLATETEGIWEGNPEVWAAVKATAMDENLPGTTMLKRDACRLLASHQAIMATVAATITVAYHDGTETPPTESLLTRAILRQVV